MSQNPLQSRNPFRLALGVVSTSILAVGLLIAVPGTSAPPKQGKSKPSAAKQTAGKLERAPRKFKHKRHEDIACNKCHAKGDKNASKTRPSRKNHSPCDSCHSDAFFGGADNTKKICQVCHAEKDPSPWKDMTELQPYPSQPAPTQRAWRVEFNHKSHTGYEGKNPARIDKCTSCHLGPPKSGGEGAKPSHKNCGSDGCHATDSGLKVTLNDCATCHVKNEGDERLIKPTNDRADKARKACRVGVKGQSYEFSRKTTAEGKFDHDVHLALQERKEYRKQTDMIVDCKTCHGNVPQAEKLSDISLFGHEKGVKIKNDVCGNKKCHGSTKWTFGLKSCTKCHNSGACKTESSSAKIFNLWGG